MGVKTPAASIPVEDDCKIWQLPETEVNVWIEWQVS